MKQILQKLKLGNLKHVLKYIYLRMMKKMQLVNHRIYIQNYNQINYEKIQYLKFQTIERWILNCALKGSNITTSRNNWELVYNRLHNLKQFINQVITKQSLNEILHNQIDSILQNEDFIEIYKNNLIYNEPIINKFKD